MKLQISMLMPANEYIDAKKKDDLDDVEQAVLSGAVPSAAYDTTATSSCGLKTDTFICTGRKSNNTVKGAMGHTTSAEAIRPLEHDLRNSAREIHIPSNPCRWICR